MVNKHAARAVGAGILAAALGAPALGDTISPTSYTNNDLAVGDSVTIDKTVVVESAGATSALIDVFFLFDTSGSMGGEINAAQTASADILAGLDSFGDAAGGVGAYAEQASLSLPPPGATINQDISTDTAVGGTVDLAIDAITLSNPDGGGDGLENGNTGITQVAENAAWRPGSNRFIFVFGDAGFKDGGTDNVAGEPISTDAETIAALDAVGADLFGLNFGGSSFADSITDLGGTSVDSSTDPDELVADIIDSIGGSFAEYTEVTVSDLGAGLPEILVEVVCTGADTGVCVGPDAVGDYDRSEDRTFTFDVTFTRQAAGDAAFPTFALVDGGAVATEDDRFGGEAPIPVPAALPLMGAALAGLGVLRARRRG